ncbi:MAG: hypothetical protein QNJ01_13605 [Desulfobacterales bacterium]|nr:hypothetical protein [Desulfobacterales bacterium]
MRKTTRIGKAFLPDRQAPRSSPLDSAKNKTGARRPDPTKMVKARQTPDKILLFTMGNHKRQILVSGKAAADGVPQA